MPFEPLDFSIGDAALNEEIALEIKKIAIDAIKSDHNYYAHPLGMEELRYEICNKIGQEYDVYYNHNVEIVITAGASHALSSVIASLTKPGDKILVPNPGWQGYVKLFSPHNVDIKYYTMLLPEASGSQGKFWEDLFNKVTAKTKFLIINSPHNPTGAVLTYEDLLLLDKLLRDNPLLNIIFDETYADLVFNKKNYFFPHATPILRSRSIIIRSFSKSLAMTGWRIGFLIASESLMPKINSYISSFGGVVNTIAQAIILNILKSRLFLSDKFCDYYKKKRNYLVNELNKLDYFNCNFPQGTFYLFPDISSFKCSSLQLANNLKEKQNILVYPGSRFGSLGENHIRLCFAKSRVQLEKLVDGLKLFIMENR